MKNLKIFLFIILAFFFVSTNSVSAATGSGSVTVTVTAPVTYTLTYTANTGGSITGTTPQTVASGSNGTAVTATPNSGYAFSSWSDGVATATRTDTNVTANKSVTASFTANTYAISYTATNGSVLPTTCTYGATVNPTCTANTGYHTTSCPLSFTCSTSNSKTATFAINQYTLTYSAGTGGSITGTTSQTVNYGSNGTAVTATPDGSHTFSSWSDGVTTATRTDTNITANKSVTASFTTITVPSTPTGLSAGTSTCGNNWLNISWNASTGATSYQVYRDGGATAIYDSSLLSFSDTGLTLGSTHTYKVRATNAGGSSALSSSVSGTVASVCTFTLSITTTGTGSGTTTGNGTYNSGTVVAITATPSTNSTFAGWSGNVDCTDGSVTMNTAKSCTATFAINQYTLTYSAGTGGSITGTTSQTVNYGSNGTAVTATPDGSHTFSSWSDGVTTATRTDTNVTANKSVTASFTAITPITVSLSASPTGPLVAPGSTTLSWTTTGNPTSCTASNYWSGSKTSSGGSELRSGMTAGTSNFIITCSKTGVSNATASVNVSVVPAPTGSITATDCLIDSNASSCPTNLAWNTINPFDTSKVTTPSFITVATANTGTATYTVDYGSRNFFLYNNGTQLGTTATANATCTTGTVWNASSGKCKPSSGTLTASNCSILLGGNSCDSTLVWTTSNPSNGVNSIVKTPDSLGTTIATVNNGTMTYPVPYNGKAFVLINNSVLLASVTATPTCTTGTNWGGSSCVANNNAPNTPTITGSTDFYTGTLQTFNITGTDSNGDTIRYGISWNNGPSADTWTSPYVVSGTTMFGTNSWATPGTYYIKALTQDAPGLNSPWSPLFTVHVTNPPVPASIISFTADKININFGESVNLTWVSTDATSCAMTSVPTPSVNFNGLAASGTKKHNPLKTTIYSLTCTGPGGSSSASPVTVTVGKIQPTVKEI